MTARSVPARPRRLRSQSARLAQYLARLACHSDLERQGFAGEVGQSVVIPRRDGATVIAVGVGERPSVEIFATPQRLRCVTLSVTKM